MSLSRFSASTPASPGEGKSRRAFLRTTGAAAALTLVLASCGDDTPPPAPDTTLYMGTGDAGVISYISLLTQFSHAFYTSVLAAPPADLPPAERAVLVDISRHAFVHREAIRLLITDNNLANIGQVTFSFAPLTLTSRQGVLEAARMVEDLLVAAWCGSAKLLATPVFLQLLIKMASVQARHAAAVRDLLQPGSFASATAVDDTGASAGLNKALTPAQVLTEIAKYTSVPLSSTGLPTS